MSEKVIELAVEPTYEPNPDVVELLEDLLTEARAGKIVNISGAVEYHDAYAGMFASLQNPAYALVGVLSCCLHMATKLSVDD